MWGCLRFSTMESDTAVEVVPDPDPADVEELVRRLVAANDRVAPPENHRRLAVFARDGDGLVGGASGHTHWGWLFVSHLWVDESAQRQGLGTELMSRIEAAAVGRGAKAAHVDTYDFQALEFYEKLGYTEFGHLDDYPIGHRRHFLTKRLDPTP